MSGSHAALTGVADAVKDHGPERKAVETGRRWHDFLASILLFNNQNTSICYAGQLSFW